MCGYYIKDEPVVDEKSSLKNKKTKEDDTTSACCYLLLAIVSCCGIIALGILALALVVLLLGELRGLAPEDIYDDMFRPCNRYDVDGCSIPFGLEFFYEAQFTRSCDRHDICYHCGVAYNLTKEDCDDAFRENTLATCEDSYLAALEDTSSNNVESQQAGLILQAVQDLGTEAVSALLEDEMTKANDAQPTSSLSEFNAWLAQPENQIKMAAMWIKTVAEYAQTLDETNYDDLVSFTITGGSDSSNEDRNISPKMIRSDRFAWKSKENSAEAELLAGVENALGEENGVPVVAGEELGSSSISYLICDLFSEIYYLAVAIFGGTSLHEEAEWYCNQSFVSKCLPDY